MKPYKPNAMITPPAAIKVFSNPPVSAKGVQPKTWPVGAGVEVGLLFEGVFVLVGTGVFSGLLVGCRVFSGMSVGTGVDVGSAFGSTVGSEVGIAVGSIVGSGVSCGVGSAVGMGVNSTVGSGVGSIVGMGVGFIGPVAGISGVGIGVSIGLINPL